MNEFISSSRWKGQKKESVKWKREQSKLSYLKNKLLCPWFNGWGAYTSEARSWRTSHCVPCLVGRTWWCLRSLGGWEKFPVTGCFLGYQGNQQRGMPLTAPLLSMVESSNLRLEQSLLAGGQGQVWGRPVMWVGCKRSRHWLNREVPRAREQPSQGAGPYREIIENKEKSLSTGIYQKLYYPCHQGQERRRESGWSRKRVPRNNWSNFLSLTKIYRFEKWGKSQSRQTQRNPY